METIAAISSIAGILSLLSQAIDNTTKFKNFLSDVSSASESVSQLLHDLDSLLQTLDAVNGLATSLPLDFKCSNVVSLHLRVEEYTKDVFNWLKVARDIRPMQEGVKAWLKKFWIASNISSVRGMREALNRHKQSICLDLSILGRIIDIYTAADVKEVKRGTAASLSMIEEQNSILERIQACTETGMHNSTISIRSLHSIATSISRIESLASSAARSSVPQKRRETGSSQAKSWSGSRWEDSGYYSFRRRTGSSMMGNRISGNSAVSLPMASRMSGAKISMLQDECISEESWETQSLAGHEQEIENTPIAESNSAEDVSPEPPTPAFEENKQPGLPYAIDRSLHKQYWSFDKITQQFTKAIYPPEVIEYIYLIQLIKDYENKVNLLNLLQFGSNMDNLILRLPEYSVESDLYVLQHQRDALRNRLETLCDDMQQLRTRCVSKGHSLYDIDHRFGIVQSNNSLESNEDNDPNSNLVRQTRQTSSEVLSNEIQRTKINPLSNWSSNRDRINRWLLHCLQNDDNQTRLHRSMLAEPPVEDTKWAKQVLETWYHDEAAVGEELMLSGSVGAVVSCSVQSGDELGLGVPRSCFRHTEWEQGRFNLSSSPYPPRPLPRMNMI